MNALLSVCSGAFALHPGLQLSHTQPHSPISPMSPKPTGSFDLYDLLAMEEVSRCESIGVGMMVWRLSFVRKRKEACGLRTTEAWARASHRLVAIF